MFCKLALAIRFTYCTDTTCTTLEAQKQRSGNQKNRRIRHKPSMILSYYKAFIANVFNLGSMEVVDQSALLIL